jgi:hypothetical protein
LRIFAGGKFGERSTSLKLRSPLSFKGTRGLFTKTPGLKEERSNFFFSLDNSFVAFGVFGVPNIFF